MMKVAAAALLIIAFAATATADDEQINRGDVTVAVAGYGHAPCPLNAEVAQERAEIVAEADTLRHSRHRLTDLMAVSNRVADLTAGLRSGSPTAAWEASDRHEPILTDADRFGYVGVGTVDAGDRTVIVAVLTSDCPTVCTWPEEVSHAPPR